MGGLRISGGVRIGRSALPRSRRPAAHGDHRRFATPVASNLPQRPILVLAEASVCARASAWVKVETSSPVSKLTRTYPISSSSATRQACR
jgi:hypothetical protein